MFCPLISFSVWTGSFRGCDEVCVSNRAASSTTAKGLFWGFPTRFANQLFLAHLWGAYAIPVALSGVRRPSFVVRRASCVVCVHHNYQK